MTEVVYNPPDGDPIVVDLREPGKAALLAWLWPGAGHFYQRRFAKGFLFMICILSIFFFGLGLGEAESSMRRRKLVISDGNLRVRLESVCRLLLQFFKR